MERKNSGSFLRTDEYDLHALQRSLARLIADRNAFMLHKNAEEIIREMCGRLSSANNAPLLLCKLVNESILQSEFFSLLMRVLAADLRTIINSTTPELTETALWKVVIMVLSHSQKELQHMRKTIVKVCSESNVPSLLVKVCEVLPPHADVVYEILVHLVVFAEVFKDLVSTSSLQWVAVPLRRTGFTEAARIQCDGTVRAILEHHKKEPQTLEFVTRHVLPGLASPDALATPNSVTDSVCLVHHIATSLSSSLPEVMASLSLANFPNALSESIAKLEILDENHGVEIFSGLRQMCLLPETSSALTPLEMDHQEKAPKGSSSSGWGLFSKVVKVVAGSTIGSRSLTGSFGGSGASAKASHPEFLEAIVRIISSRQEMHIHIIGVRTVRELFLSHPGNYQSLQGRKQLIMLLRNLRMLTPPSQHMVVRLLNELVVKHGVIVGEEVMGLIAGMHHQLPGSTAIVCFNTLQMLLSHANTVQTVLDSGVLSVLHHFLASISSDKKPLYVPDGPEEANSLREATKNVMLTIVTSKQGLAALVADVFVPTAVALIHTTSDNRMAREVLETLTPYCTNFLTYSMIAHFRAQPELTEVVELLAMIARNKKLVVSFLANDGVEVLLKGPLSTESDIGTHASAMLCGLLTSLLLAAPTSEGSILPLAEKIQWTTALVFDCITGTAATSPRYFDVQMGEGVSWSLGHLSSGYDTIVLPSVLNEIAHFNFFKEKSAMESLAVLLARVPCAFNKLIPFSDFIQTLIESLPKPPSLLRVLHLLSTCHAKRYHETITRALTRHPSTLADFAEIAFRDEDATDSFVTPHVLLFPQSSMQIRNISFIDGTVWPPMSGYSISLWVKHHTAFHASDTSLCPVFRCQWYDTESSDPSAVSFVQISLVPCGGVVVTLNLPTARNMVGVSLTAPRDVKFPSCLLLPGVWQHIVLVHSKTRMFSGELALYKNGTLVATQSESYPVGLGTMAANISSFAMMVTMASQEDIVHFGPIALFEEPLTVAQVEGVYGIRLLYHGKSSSDDRSILKMRSMSRNVKRWLRMQRVETIDSLQMPAFPVSCLFYINPSCMTSPTSFSESSGRTKLSQGYVEGLHAAPWFPSGSNVVSVVRGNQAVIRAVIENIGNDPRLLKFLIMLMELSEEEDVAHYLSICHAVRPYVEVLLPILLSGCETEIRPEKYIISNLLLLEHVLLNPTLWAVMTDAQCTKLLKHIVQRWLLVSESLTTFNAMRLSQCHFLSRILTNISVNGKGITVVIYVSDMVKRYLVCGGLNAHDIHIICGILDHFSRFGQVLGVPTLTVSFRTTVLNLLLRVLCDLSENHTQLLATSLSKTVGPMWFMKFLQPECHSVTRTFALHLFAVVMSADQHFSYMVEKRNTLRALRHVLCLEQTFVDVNMYSILIMLVFGERLKLCFFDDDEAMLHVRNVMRSTPPAAVCYPSIVTLLFAVLQSHFYETRTCCYVKYFASMLTASKRATTRWAIAGWVVRAMCRWMKAAKVAIFHAGFITTVPEGSPPRDAKTPVVSLVVQVCLKVFADHSSNDFIVTYFSPMHLCNPVDSLTAMFFQCLKCNSSLSLDRSSTSEAASPAMLFSPSGDITEAVGGNEALEETSPDLFDDLASTLSGSIYRGSFSMEGVLVPNEYSLGSPHTPSQTPSLGPGGAAEVPHEDPSVIQVRDMIAEVMGTQLPHIMLATQDTGMASASPSKLKYLPAAQCLHRCLNNYPMCTVAQASYWNNLLCTLWLKALERRVTVRSLLEDSASKIIAANAVGVCEYFVDRLHSGSITPIPDLLKTLSHVAARFQEANLMDSAKAVRAIAHRVVLLVLSPNFHKCDVALLHPVLQVLVQITPNVLSAKACHMDFLRLISSRLFSLLEVVDVRNYTLIIFRTVLRIVREMSLIDKLFVKNSSKTTSSSKRQDVFRGGLELLFFADNNAQFLKWYEAQQEIPTSGDNVFAFFAHVRAKYTAPQQLKEIHFGKIVLFDTHTFRRKHQQDYENAMKECAKIWSQADIRPQGGTWVDIALLGNGVLTRHRSVVCEVGPMQRVEISPSSCLLMGTTPATATPESFLLQDDPCEPLAFCVPPSCFTFNPSLGVTSAEAINEGALKISPSVGALTPGARALLRLIIGAKIVKDTKVTALANGYKVLGIISTPVLVIVTTSELIAVSHGRVTPEGDIVVSLQEKTHEASDTKSGNKKTSGSTWFEGFVHNQMWRAGSTSTTKMQANRDHSRALRAAIHTSGSSQSEVCSLVWRYPSAALRSITHRSLHHSPAALELEYAGNQRIFIAILDRSLTLHAKGREQLASALLSTATHHDPTLHTVKSMLSDLRQFTRLWVNCDISTFEYLYHVNNAAGRSFLDYNQYPVMPWVHSRDLTKPMGAQDPTRAAEFRQRYEEWLDPDQPRFHYGSHYSTSAIVMYYKVRCQPNTAMSILYQGGKLDVADRLFHSFQEAWYSSSRGSRTDVKELIPEFYDVESTGAVAMFLNANRVALGVNRDGVELGDVVLTAPWSSDPFTFLVQHRDALESDSSSTYMNSWIDLIFGAQQRGVEAQRALNVFHPLTYEDGVEAALAACADQEGACQAIVTALENFGITPCCVFGDIPHPRRGRRIGPTSAQILLNHTQEMLSRNVEANTVPHAVSDIRVRAYDGGFVVASSQWKPKFVVNGRLTTATWLQTHRCLRSIDTGILYQTDAVVSVVRLTTCGTLLLLGTTLGSLVLCTRTPHGKFELMTTCVDAHTEAVVEISIEEGRGGGLVLSHSILDVCVWRVTSTYCHLVCRHNLPFESDRILASCLVRTMFFLVSTERAMLLYGFTNGFILSSPLEGTASVSAIHCLTMRDWSATFVIVAGHKDGTISFWELTLHPVALRSHVEITSMMAPVTAIGSRLNGSEIYIGYDTGAVVVLSLPETDSTQFVTLVNNESIGSNKEERESTSGSFLNPFPQTPLMQSLADYVM